MYVSLDDFFTDPERKQEFLIKLWRSVIEPCQCNRCKLRGARCRPRRPFGWYDTSLPGLTEQRNRLR